MQLNIFLEEYDLDYIPGTYHTYEGAAKLYLEAKDDIKLIKCSKDTLPIDWCVGIPDFFYIKDGIKYFVEIKCNEDGLRKSQVIWIMQHPDEIIRVCWFRFDWKKPRIKSYPLNDEILTEQQVDEKLRDIQTSSRSKISIMKEMILNLEIFNKIIPIEVLIKETIARYGMQESDIIDTIEQLKRLGDIFESKRGFIQRI